LRNPNCTACPLHTAVTNVCIWGVGPTSGLMLVGEAPGAVEDASGKPFVGPAGEVLTRCLNAAGLSRGEVYITNTTKCRPPDNRDPALDESEACEHYLRQEIVHVKPRTIIALGNNALKRLTGRGEITKNRGGVFDLHERFESKVSVVAAFHPAYIARRPDQEQALVNDLVYAAGLNTARHRGGEIVLCTTPRAYSLMGEYIARAAIEKRPVALDIETPGKRSPWEPGASIYMLGAAVTPDLAFVMPLAHPESPWPNAEEKFWPVVGPWLERLKFVGQNTKFERQWLAIRGVKLNPWLDTMLMSHFLDETKTHNLNDMSRRLFGAPPYGQNIDYVNEPLATYAEYCGWDCLYTLRAALLWQAYADDPFYRFIMDVSEAVSRMEINGIALDLGRLKQREAELIEKREDAAIELPKEINLRSPAQVAQWLVDEGVALGERTPTGKLSVSKDALLPVRNEPAVKAYRSWKDVDELVTKFTTKWPAYVMEDGRIHASYFPLTETGRHRCSRPNIQQVPRGNLRSVFVAGPGMEMVSWDASQVELRMAAHISEDPAMMEAYKRGLDLHLINGGTVAYEAALQAAHLLLVRADLPPDWAGAEVLRTVWDRAGQISITAAFLQLVSEEWSHQEPRRRERWRSMGTKQPILEGWDIAAASAEAPESALRRVRGWRSAMRSSHEPESAGQSALELEDALSLVSRTDPQFLAELTNVDWYEIRQKGKSSSFGYLFGMGAQKFVRYALESYGVGFSLPEAEVVRRAYFMRFPGLLAYHQETERMLIRDRRLVSEFGRVRHLDEIASSDWKVRSHAVRQGINFRIQAPSADITHAAVVIANNWPDVKAVATVHDSILWEQPQGTGDTLAAALMPAAIDLLRERFGWEPKVPFEADWVVGDCWL